MEQVLTGMSKFYMDEVRKIGFRGIVTNWDMYMRLMDIPPRLPMTAVAMHTYFSHPNLVPLPVRGYSQELRNLRWFRGERHHDLAGEFHHGPQLLHRPGGSQPFLRPSVSDNRIFSFPLQLPCARGRSDVGSLLRRFRDGTCSPSMETPFRSGTSPLNGFVFEGSLSPMARGERGQLPRSPGSEAMSRKQNTNWRLRFRNAQCSPRNFMNAIGGEYSRLFMVHENRLFL